MAFHPELLKVVGNIEFEIYKVTTTFNPESSLSSSVDLSLGLHRDKCGSNIVIKTRDLFDIDELESNVQNADAFKFVNPNPGHHLVCYHPTW